MENAFLTKAPSTCVPIFLNPHFFKKFPRPHVAYSNRIRLFTRIRWYPDSLWRNSAYTLCRHIGLLFVKKLDTICYVIEFENIRIHPSTRYRIRFRFIFFHSESGEGIQKYPDTLPNSPDACGRKSYPERKSCGFINIWIRVDRA